MKLIEAVVRPEKLDAVKQALYDTGINGLNIKQISGCGKQHGWIDEPVNMMNVNAKIEIKTVVPENKVEEVIAVIEKTARTGEIGDGKIFIKPVEDCIQIRTGLRGIKALG